MRDARLASDVGARRGRHDVYCYFDNDTKVRAPYDAAHLAMRLGLPTGFEPGEQATRNAASSGTKKAGRGG